MASSIASFHGGPCDFQSTYITYRGDPPATLRCQGTTYYYFPQSRGVLVYMTADYRDNFNVALAVRGQRDVFRAFHRLMGTLTHRVEGERRRVEHARHRIRRAVR